MQLIHTTGARAPSAIWRRRRGRAAPVSGDAWGSCLIDTTYARERLSRGGWSDSAKAERKRGASQARDLCQLLNGYHLCGSGRWRHLLLVRGNFESNTCGDLVGRCRAIYVERCWSVRSGSDFELRWPASLVGVRYRACCCC